MALPSSGPMRLGADVNVELGLSATAQISLGSAAVRGLYGVASGAIRLAADGYGKASAFVFNQTIASNTNDYDLRNAAIAAGWDQVLVLLATVTINSGVFVGSSSTGTAAFSTGSTYPAGSSITIVNNGSIVGRGGAGGTGAGFSNQPLNGNPGQVGGPAINLLTNITLNNFGTIGGGGGGGGGGAAAGFAFPGLLVKCGGGGGGGGQANGGAGAGGSVSGPTTPISGTSGNSGTLSSSGGGGAGGASPGLSTFAGNGGGGGTLGNSGAAGGNSNGGNLGFRTGGAGGESGKAINLNGFSISYAPFGTILGVVS